MARPILIPSLLALMTLTSFWSDAFADGEYTCQGERIERGSSTWGYARPSGDDYRIEKGSSSIGFAKSRGSKWAIETFGSTTLGWLDGEDINKPNNAGWAKLADAERMVVGCPSAVAAALWVLHESGKL